MSVYPVSGLILLLKDNLVLSFSWILSNFTKKNRALINSKIGCVIMFYKHGNSSSFRPPYPCAYVCVGSP